MRLRDKIKLKNILIDKIKPKEIEIFEPGLQDSLLEIEQKKPIDVRPIEHPTYNYETIDGGRRLIALKQAGADKILCEVWFGVDDTEYSIRLLTGNSGKPNPMEEAVHMDRLSQKGYTLEEIGKLCNYSPARICQTIKLVYQLVPELQEKVKSGDMKISAAQMACKLSKEEQHSLASTNDKISLQAVSEALNKQQSEEFILPDNFGEEETEIKPGLFLSYEQMEKLLDGEKVLVEYNHLDLTLNLSGIANNKRYDEEEINEKN